VSSMRDEVHAVTGDIEVDLPGRFTVLVGANAAGKTTLSDAIYLGRRRRFWPPVESQLPFRIVPAPPRTTRPLAQRLVPEAPVLDLLDQLG
jgi:hypothetical protein